MNTWKSKFASLPLPYTYVQVPERGQAAYQSAFPLKYYVNKVITNLTRSCFKLAGMAVTTDPHQWNASWGRQYSMAEYQQCQCWQKINHFAGAYLMGRKDNLHKRMMELKQRIGDRASFYPESYLLPGDMEALEKRWKEVPVWIIKPSASSRGRGIRLVSSADNEVVTEDGIVQEYILHPMLITQRKFDIRLYIYVASIKPLRIYMHRVGMARFCTHEYDEHGDVADAHMHLTNFTLNKEDKEFVRSNGREEHIENSKWSLDFFLSYLTEHKFPAQELMRECERVSVDTVIAGMCEIRKKHCAMVHHRHTSHELFGIDLMIDSDMRVHLIEINISPSLSGLDSKLDEDLKFPVNLDVLRMGRMIESDPTLDDPCPGVRLIDEHYFRAMTKERVAKIESRREHPWQKPVFSDFQIVRDYLEETDIHSGFRLVYPVPETMQEFNKCADRLPYQDVVFQRWITMSDADKERVLARHWCVYEETMMQIFRELEVTNEE